MVVAALVATGRVARVERVETPARSWYRFGPARIEALPNAFLEPDRCIGIIQSDGV
jgi:hypothetical protein